MATKKSTKKATKTKRTAQSAASKSNVTRTGPSNKEVVYKLYLKDPKTAAEKAEQFHKAVKEAVKLTTIRSWISMWSHGKGLPACANKK